MPKGQWNDPGTKQGIYMIGPGGEYLEGKGAASGTPRKIAQRLERALEGWKKLRKEKGYANKPVPRAAKVAPPEFEGKPLVLRVHLRDLPRNAQDDSGRRFNKADFRGMWMQFTEWAWNENWISFDDPKALITKSKKPQPVDSAFVTRLCRRVLVDNVRGQTPGWKAEHVQSASLTVRRTKVKSGRWLLEYQGTAQMKSGRQTFAPKIYGRGVWNPKRKSFDSLDLVAVGMRSGAGSFNQRGSDKGAAPMGIALGLFPAAQ